jgi:hypothetical protein
VAAIPNQLLNPHSDAAADISYIQDNTKKPDETNHFHLPLRTGEQLTLTDTTSSYSLQSNKGWEAHAVWDNAMYRWMDTPAEGDGKNALRDKFAHGYISPASFPRYAFDEVPEMAKPLIAETFTEWNKSAKAQSAGKTTPGGKALKTNIKFEPAGKGQASQLTFRFTDGLQGPPRNVYAEWVSSQDRLGGKVTQTMTMYYQTDPTNFILAPEGYAIKKKGSANAFGNTYGETVGWSFDKTPDVKVEVDILYRRTSDGMDLDALPGQMLRTNTGLTIAADDKIKFYEMDFFTMALHETGHILGLQHTPGDPMNAIMRENIAAQASFGKKFPMIDENSAYGAALLYTIPVPEPGGWLTAAVGGVLLSWRRSGRRGR